MIVRCPCWFISCVSFPVIFLQNSPFCCTGINHWCYNAAIENGAVHYAHTRATRLSYCLLMLLKILNIVVDFWKIKSEFLWE